MHEPSYIRKDPQPKRATQTRGEATKYHSKSWSTKEIFGELMEDGGM